MSELQQLSIGIEEEYLLVDPQTRDLARNPSPALFEACAARLGDRVNPEFLRCQIEVGTPVCASIAEARAELSALRACVSEIAQAHGLAIIAASTHPFADWRPQETTDRDRYQQLAAEIGQPARRLLTCAMHVHVGIDNPDLRIDLMNQARYFLPHLLALSTSSPFWSGTPTGLRSYRLAVFDELPRTGTPEEFESYAEYRRHVEMLVKTGVIEDATKIWWDLRPSDRFPTLEMRITDICTRLDDGIAIAAIYACVLRMLERLRRANIRWRRYKPMLTEENRWRAMRYGLDEGLIDFGKEAVVAYPALLDEIIALVAEDADALGCRAEIEHARKIVAEGSSAHRQQSVYDAALASGASAQEALAAVVDHLIAETRQGVRPA